MNPSIKRLLGALLLIGTLGASSVLAIRAQAEVYSALACSHAIDGAGVCGADTLRPRVDRPIPETPGAETPSACSPGACSPGARSFDVYRNKMFAAVTPATCGASY